MKNDIFINGEPYASYFTTVNNTKLHYVKGGHGTVTILLLHGWPYTWQEWEPVLPGLINAGFTVIVPDLHGCGQSEKPVKPQTKLEIAEGLSELIDELEETTVYVVGMDIGMMAAYALASNFPEKIKKLVLGEGVLPGFGLEELMDPAKGGSWHFGFQAQSEFASNVIAGNEEAYHNNFWKMMSPVKGINRDSIQPYLQYYGNTDGSRGGFSHYTTLLEDGIFNRNNPNKMLQMPVLILNGDQGIPQSLTLNSVSQVSENYNTVLIRDCGHTLAEENPMGTLAALLQFFND